VREAVVVVREDAVDDRRLVAYLVPAHLQAERPAAELRKHLKTSLPGYMVPATFVNMERIPLTPNGKVDHKALPVPSEGIKPGSEMVQAQPGNQMERSLAAIWRAVLGHERFGVDDSFFEVGGNSLLLMEVVMRLRAQWRDSLLTVDMFAHPTVRTMAQYLTQESDNGPRPDSLRLSHRLERRNQAFEELRRKRPKGE
jgi:Phosphopantetheine attachment site/AMP-binding enzyme C-terminal domain